MVESSEKRVVVADDRDVVRNAQTSVLEAVDHRRCGKVVRGEDRRREAPRAENRVRRRKPRKVGVVTSDDADLAHQLRATHRLLVSRPPRRRTRAAPPVDVRDRTMPESNEMLDDEPRAVALVVRDRVDRLRSHAAGDDDDWHRRRRPGDLGGRQPRANEDRAVDTKLEERVESCLLPARPAARRAEKDAVSRLGRARVDAVHDLGVERVVELVQQHADRLLPATREAPRPRVRAIAELRRRREDARAPLLAHLRALAQHQRNKGPRDAGLPRDVVHRRLALDTLVCSSDNRLS